MKKRVLSLIEKLRPLGLLFFVIFATQLKALASDVTYSTEALAAGNVLQGSVDHPIYSIKIVAGATDVTLETVKAKTSGTYTAADIDGFNVYVNTTNSIAGASFVRANNDAIAGSGETVYFNYLNNTVIPAGQTVYLMFVANVNLAATDGHTIKVDGSANPITVTYQATTPTITNSQTNAAGLQTIKAPIVTYTTETLAAGNVLQGSVDHPIYSLKIVAGPTPVTLSAVKVKISGTYAATDIDGFNVHVSTTNSIVGASFVRSNTYAPAGNGEIAEFNYLNNTVVAAGQTVYLIFTASVNMVATDGHTIKVDGSTNPVVVTYQATTPIVTNSQTNAVGLQTIKAPTLTYTTETTAAGNVFQGSVDHPIYSLKIVAGSTPVTLSSIKVKTGGIYVAADIDGFNVYVNTTNAVAGASFVRSNNFAPAGGGETVEFNYLNNTIIPPGQAIYLIVTVNVNLAAIDGHTIKVDGSANPVAVTYVATTPTITNSQTNVAGLQTIKAPTVTYSTETLAAGNVLQGSVDHPIYSLKIVAGSTPVTLNSLKVKTSGTYTASDIDGFNVYVNTTNSIAGASYVRANNDAIAGNGETVYFNYLNNNVIPAGQTAYLIFAASINLAATDGHTIKVDGSANPVAVTYVATTPTITNSQTNVAGLQTIKAPTVTYSTETLAPSNILQGSVDNPFYSLKIVVGPTPVTLSSLRIKTSGTYTASDIDGFNVYVNTSNSIAGASYVRANNDAIAGNGETVYFNYLNNTLIPAGQTVYLIVVANLSSSATGNHTIKVDGSANPVAVSYVTTTPIVTNNQTNIAGKQTIGTPSFTYSTETSAAKIIARGTSLHPFYTLKLQLGATGATITNITAKTSGTYNASDITSFTLYKNSVPGILGATLLSTNATSTGAGENLSFDTGYLELDASTTSYLIVRANINASATAGHTFQIDGGSNPVVMTNSGVAATITNSQTNAAGIQTIGIPPAFSPALGNLTATTDAGLCTALKTYGASTTGYPTPTITYIFTGATTGSGPGSGTGSVFNKGVTHIQLTASNGCEPTPTAVGSFDLTITDAEQPTIIAPAAVSATTNTACTASGVALGTPVTADNCAVLTVTNNAPSAFPLGATTVTWTVTDAAGNFKTATQIVTVTDNIAPAITAPATVNAFTNTNCTATGVALGTPVTSDNCSVLSVTDDRPAAFPLGSTTVTWTVTDGSGNTKTATQTVIVTDDVKPTITAPAGVTATTNAACTATGVIIGTATATDNCTASPTITNNAPSTFPLGLTTVTWTATDAAGNTKTATQTVTVTDNVAPTITAPANVSATTNTACTATGVALGTPVTADNCSVASVTSNAPTAFPLGATTVTWTVTDGSGNTKTATQTVTITDNIAPTITAPANKTVTTNTACTATGVALGTPVTSDNCLVASVTSNAPSSFPLGVTTVTWTVTDGSGNIKTATQTVTVTDNVLPAITAPANVSVTSNAGCTATGVTLGTATATDNCTASPTITNNAPSTFPLGVTMVTWTATDAAGNTKTATQTVTVTDNVAPSITAPANISATTNTACTATGVALGTPTASDNCAAPTVSNNAPTAFPLGVTTVTWTATDAAGNTKTATQTVTVTDNVAPTITAPANKTATTNSACTAIGVALGTPVTNDNCSVASVTSNAPSAFPLGMTTVTWTVTDGSGNIKTTTQTVTVTDNVLPAITAPTNMTVTANGTCTATVADLGTATATDNCTVNPTISNNAPATFSLGVTTVTWTATDASGNTKTATQTVTVTDGIPPVKPVLADITGLCSVTPSAPTTTDNCAGTVNGTTSTLFPITAIGTTVITWTFSDGHGNSVTANQNIIITVSTDIAMSETTSNQTIVAGDNYFQDANCKLVAKVTAGTLSGITRSKVWIESANVTGPYVKRHYQITPDENPNTATSFVTLYFTQAEFDAYSTAFTTAQLPANATDAAGKANLRIVKFPGNSTDAGGLVYDPSTALSIDPIDSDINYLNGRWEVKFEVTGFSGFFVNTISTPLPVTLVSFNGKRTGENEVTLNWVSSDEKDFDRFEIQRSDDAKSFETIGTVQGLIATNTALKNYQFVDRNNAYAANYYRLKMVDKDASFEYSKIIHLGSSIAKSVIGQFYPNPTASMESYIDVVATETGKWTIKTYDLSGRLLSTENRSLNKGTNKIKMTLDKTIYGSSLIQFESKDQVEVRKIIRQ